MWFYEFEHTCPGGPREKGGPDVPCGQVLAVIGSYQPLTNAPYVQSAYGD